MLSENQPLYAGLYTLTTMAMVTIGFITNFSEPQNIEQGMSNVEVTPS